MEQAPLDPALLDLIKTLYAQAGKSIPVDELPIVAIYRAFDGGDAIAALMRHHPRYNEDKGRIFPFYDDDEGVDDVEDLSDDAILSLIEDIAYEWNNVENASSVSGFAYSYSEMCNSIAALATWHPSYNDNGVIED